MKKYIAILLTLCFTAFAATAIEINCVAGRLVSTLNDKTIDRLCIKGSVDASDLFFIADELENLKELDLSGCTIEAYRGIPVHGQAHYEAATIPGGTFAASHIETIHFPTDGTLHIGDAAFISSGLKSLNISCNVTIGTGAFASCESLGDVRITGRAIIGEYAFRSCKSLSTADLTGAIEIGVKAFAACTQLHTAVFGKDISVIGASSFEGCGLKSINLENTIVNTIGNRAFAQNTSLENILLPQSVKTLGEGLLFDCHALGEFSIPPTCTSLPDYALKDTGIGHISLGNLVEIGAYSLKGNSSLSTITLPATLERIGNNAMEGMTGLTSIEATALKSVPSIGNDVWAGIDRPAVLLLTAKDMVTQFRQSPQWQDFLILDEAQSSIKNTDVTKELNYTLHDDILAIESPESPITEVSVYSPDGKTTISARPSNRMCTLNLSGQSARILIIHIILADSTVANLKISR